jgi:hypothetical protein
MRQKLIHLLISFCPFPLSPDDGTQYKIDLDKKWSSTILTELLDLHTRRGANVKFKAGEVTRGKNEQRQPRGKADSTRLLSGSQRTSSNRKHAV